MKTNSSRRDFLAAGFALPMTGLAPRPPQPPLSSPPPPAAELRHRTLGKTGLKVTSMGFGCMITSDPSVIEKAADMGINFFDSSRGYQGGNNERMVGAALKTRRKKIYLSTKADAKSKKGALEELDTSLRELSTDYLDVWSLHGLSRPDDLTDELIDALLTAKKQGKTRFVGVSTHRGQPDVIPALISKGTFDVVIAAYNFSLDKSVDAAIEAARSAGLGVVAMKVMAGGFRRLRPGDRAQAALKRQGAMLAALKWVLNNPKVDTTIPSMTDMEQLDENMKAMTAPFTDADRQLLAAQLEYIAPLYCRMCGQCEGSCPKGLPVSDILRYLSYAEGYGQFPLGRERFLALPSEVTQVRCNLCPTCSVQCPFGVRVAERLTRAQELFA